MEGRALGVPELHLHDAQVDRRPAPAVGHPGHRRVQPPVHGPDHAEGHRRQPEPVLRRRHQRRRPRRSRRRPRGLHPLGVRGGRRHARAAHAPSWAATGRPRSSPPTTASPRSGRRSTSARCSSTSACRSASRAATAARRRTTPARRHPATPSPRSATPAAPRRSTSTSPGAIRRPATRRRCRPPTTRPSVTRSSRRSRTWTTRTSPASSRSCSRCFKKEELRNVDGTDSLHPSRSGDVVVVFRPPYQTDAQTPGQLVAPSQFFGQHGYLPDLVNLKRNVNMHGTFIAAGPGIRTRDKDPVAACAPSTSRRRWRS